MSHAAGVLLLFAVTAGASALFVPRASTLVQGFDLLDRPGPRRSHHRPVPERAYPCSFSRSGSGSDWVLRPPSAGS